MRTRRRSTVKFKRSALKTSTAKPKRRKTIQKSFSSISTHTYTAGNKKFQIQTPKRRPGETMAEWYKRWSTKAKQRYREYKAEYNRQRNGKVAIKTKSEQKHKRNCAAGENLYRYTVKMLDKTP